MRKEDEQALRERVAYLHGRIEREVEAFADSLDVPRVELTRWMGALLLGIGPGYANTMPDLQGSRNHLETGATHPPSPTLESLIESHGSLPQPERAEASISASEADASKVERFSKAGKASKNYWAKMTPRQRSREMQRRMSLWSSKSKKAWRSNRPNRKAAKQTTPKKKTPSKPKKVVAAVAQPAAA